MPACSTSKLLRFCLVYVCVCLSQIHTMFVCATCVCYPGVTYCGATLSRECRTAYWSSMSFRYRVGANELYRCNSAGNGVRFRNTCTHGCVGWTSSAMDDECLAEPVCKCATGTKYCGRGLSDACRAAIKYTTFSANALYVCRKTDNSAYGYDDGSGELTLDSTCQNGCTIKTASNSHDYCKSTAVCSCNPGVKYCGRGLSDACRSAIKYTTFSATALYVCRKTDNTVDGYDDGSGELVLDSTCQHGCTVDSRRSNDYCTSTAVCMCNNGIKYCGRGISDACKSAIKNATFSPTALYDCKNTDNSAYGYDDGSGELTLDSTCQHGCMIEMDGDRDDHCRPTAGCTCNAGVKYCGQGLPDVCRSAVKYTGFSPTALYVCRKTDNSAYGYDDGSSELTLDSTCPHGCTTEMESSSSSDYCKSTSVCICNVAVKYCGRAIPRNCKSSNQHSSSLYTCNKVQNSGYDNDSYNFALDRPCQHGCKAYTAASMDDQCLLKPVCQCYPGLNYCGENMPAACQAEFPGGINAAWLYRCHAVANRNFTDGSGHFTLERLCQHGCTSATSDEGVTNLCFVPGTSAMAPTLPVVEQTTPGPLIMSETTPKAVATLPPVDAVSGVNECICMANRHYCGRAVPQGCRGGVVFEDEDVHVCQTGGSTFQARPVIACTHGCLVTLNPRRNDRCDGEHSLPPVGSPSTRNSGEDYFGYAIQEREGHRISDSSGEAYEPGAVPFTTEPPSPDDN